MSGLLPQHGEILLYDNGADKQFVSVVFKDETFWLTQSGMAELFDCSADNISLHLKNIYADGELEQAAFELDDRFCTTVMLVSQGYPGDYEKGKEITGVSDVKGSIVFHAGTKLAEGRVVTNGGRVIAVSSFGKTMREALAQSYENVAKIHFEGMNFRRDIGFDL